MVDSNYTCLAVASLYCTQEILYYPQVDLKECKYPEKDLFNKKCVK